MEKQISFTGINLTPYGDLSPDGQCCVLHNLEVHDGSLRPAVLAGHEYTLNSSGGYTLAFVHVTSAFRHFIFRRVVPDTSVSPSFGSKGITDVSWASEDASSPELSPVWIDYAPSLIKVTAVGNTLVLLTSSGLRYYLWSEGGYKYIGDRLPELQAQFSLCTAYGEDDDTESGEVPDKTGLQGGYMPLFTADCQRLYDDSKLDSSQAVSDYINARINYIISRRSKFGCFVAPFFVRMAYRLYDGTCTMATVPVLLLPDTSHRVRCVLQELTGSQKVDGCSHKLTIESAYTRFYGWRICAKILSAGNLSSWSDIVSSVEVYATQQVFPYRLDAYVDRLFPAGECQAGYGIWADGKGDSDRAPRQQEEFDDEDFTVVDNVASDTTQGNYIIRMPMKTTEEFVDELAASTQFYKVYEYSLDQFLQDLSVPLFRRLKIDTGRVSNLVQQELLDESYDYHSHDTLVPEGAMVYNSRLNLFDVSRVPFSGFPVNVMNQFVYSDSPVVLDAYVYIHADDGLTRVVRASCTGQTLRLGLFFYYPDSRAYRMQVFTAAGQCYDIPLKVHPFLNGSYYLSWDALDVEPVAGVTPPAVVLDAVSELNKVYVSDALNPYVFPSSGVYTVGSGRILGMSSIATPVSTGQAGQFKLLLFCDDGNYALDVASDGTFSNLTPLQRDVCCSPSLITTLDRETLFLTARGAMVTDEASVTCLSAALDGVPDGLPSGYDDALSVPVPSVGQLLTALHVAYDYANQRVIFFLPDGNAFLLGLRDGEWSTATLPAVRAVINVYPASYVQYSDSGAVVRLDSVYDYADAGDSSVQGVLCTRPLKLGTFQLKRFSSFVVQGLSFASVTSLYGSQDGLSWSHLGTTSSPRRAHLVGRSFKYFRLVIQVSLPSGGCLSGVRIAYEVNRQSPLR
jgi:hypothetical protein